jgi:Holliday junction resolvase RusA-like endonuclease
MVLIQFIVPGQPQGKGRPRIGKVGQHARMFTPAKTVAYEGLIAHAAHTAMAGRPLIDGPVECELRIDCQVPASWSAKKQRQALVGEIRPTTKPDADNVVKAVFDGCNGVLWRDDVQVVGLRVTKRYAAVPMIEVRAWELFPPVEQPALIADEPQPQRQPEAAAMDF